MTARRGRITRCLAAVLAAVAMAATVAEAIDVRSWDQIITNVNQRFVVLSAFYDKAVLDKETQLVWLRSPLTEERFNDARGLCTQAGLGRRGWRLRLARLESVHADDDSLAGLDLALVAVGRLLDLALDEAALDGGHRAAQLVDTPDDLPGLLFCFWLHFHRVSVVTGVVPSHPRIGGVAAHQEMPRSHL